MHWCSKTRPGRPRRTLSAVPGAVEIVQAVVPERAAQREAEEVEHPAGRQRLRLGHHRRGPLLFLLATPHGNPALQQLQVAEPLSLHASRLVRHRFFLRGNCIFSVRTAPLLGRRGGSRNGVVRHLTPRTRARESPDAGPRLVASQAGRGGARPPKRRNSPITLPRLGHEAECSLAIGRAPQMKFASSGRPLLIQAFYGDGLGRLLGRFWSRGTKSRGRLKC